MRSSRRERRAVRMKGDGMPQCFVIMPYGGNDEEKRKHFTGVYDIIFAPAAIKAGFEPRRSDISGEPGSITADIITALAKAEMVIADLTDANANVFFELGIRHALKKSGTVHVVDSSHQIPFDVRQYRAIHYTVDLVSIPAAIDAIAAAITKRIESPGKSDNPVHDTLPSLPRDLQDVGDAALRDQLEDMQKQVSTLSERNEHLEGRLLEETREDTLVDSADSQTDVEILAAAGEVMRTTGHYVTLRLTAAREKGPEAMATEIEEIVQSPYLSPEDFIEIARQCMVAGLDSYRLAVLEIAHKRFGDLGSIVIRLADAYDDSGNPTSWEKGRVMCEEYLGIVDDSGRMVFNGRPAGDAEHAVMILFNIYFKTRRQSAVLSIAEEWEKMFGPDARMLRNAGRAYQEMGDYLESENTLRRALEADPDDDMTHAILADLLDDLGRREEAYDEHIEAIRCDRDDGTKYANLAIHILNRGNYRDEDGEFMTAASQSQRLSLAMPLFIRSLDDVQRQTMIRARVVNILVRADAVVEAQAIADGEQPHGEYDLRALNAVDQLLSSQ